MSSTLRIVLRVLVSFVLGGLPAVAGAAPFGLTLDGDTLYRVDLTYGSDPVPVVEFGLAPGAGCEASTADTDGTLWAVRVEADASRTLFHLDPATGDAEVVAVLSDELQSLAAGPGGRLFGATVGGPGPQPPLLYEVDRGTGALSLLFSLPSARATALASDGSRLCVTHQPAAGPCELADVDLVTGELTEVAALDDLACSSNSLAADADGDLWVAEVTSGVILGQISSVVWRIDLSTGEAVHVGVTGGIEPRPPGTILHNLAAVTLGGSVAPLEVPVLDPAALAALAFLLAVAGLLAVRARS